ncbi:NACHT domain-containing protein [Arsenophonus nasoniae]|uniref:NACHT domain-containing protein n=1 Tax=Arsenophonus nasoniae TaxID=638 RepID=A0AA95GSQ7_9GAMM|nr:NACHT domain-containing protein [Arsenophonus nasoniae]WGM03341.1 NACHT domain-containing protein [Arsenophonus nasoniae]
MQPITLDGMIASSLPWAKKVIKKIIIPVIYSRIKHYLNDVRSARFLNESMEKFLSRVGGQCSLVNTLAFQNTPVELKKIYEPVFVYNDNKQSSYECFINNKIDLLDSYDHILIADSAGMGKSTLMKRIALHCIEETKFIPIYIELRRVKDYSIANQVKNQLGLESDISNDCLREIPFIYLFDGIDEIPQGIKSSVVNLLKDFSNEFQNSKIIITSRQDGFLSELYGFSRFKIRALDVHQAYSLLMRYDSTGNISSKLIKGLRLKEGRNFDEFLSTPLYVSLLFCAYKFKPIIPRKKELFYSQVFDALFESHDLTKEIGYVREKHSRLDSTDFHQILRRLGFWCLKEGGRIEFTKDDLQIIIKKIVSKIPGIKVSPSLFIKDLIETVPLFVKEGSIIRWSHKSLMEYFSAMFICRDTKERQGGILKDICKKDRCVRYKNLFELCADIDYSTFRASVIKTILEDYIDLYNKLITGNKNHSSIEVMLKAEILFSGRALIYIFSKRVESKILSNLINGDFREFGELNHNDGYLSTTMVDVGDAWVVIARNETIASCILSILKERNPEYFHSEHRLKNDDKDLIIEVSRATKLSNEIQIDVSFETILNCNKKENIDLIFGILTFDKTPKLNYLKALIELNKIKTDDSNGINQLLEGF